MGKPSLVTLHIDDVRHQLARAHLEANQTLAVLGDPRSALIRHGTQAVFAYAQYPHRPVPETIPIAQFHRHHALRLETLGMTMHGYYLRRVINGRAEVTLSMRRPALWRRALGLAPVFACTLLATDATVNLTIVTAPASMPPGDAHFIFTLDSRYQNELRQRYRALLTANLILRRILAALARHCRM